MGAKSKGKTIRIDLDFLPRLTNKLTKRTAQYDKVMEQRVKRATEMVWRIAHQKRPLISKAEMGRFAYNKDFDSLVVEGHGRRVSDPNAQLGVPVRTGALQASIQKKVSRTKLMSFAGMVWTKGIGYAAYIEYGTSKMRARPFMRPAVNLTKDAIKRMFGLKVEQTP